MFAPLSPAAQAELLRSIVERSRPEPGKARPVVVFDLDATLYDNRPRTLQILMEYAEEVRADFPDVASALATLDEEHRELIVLRDLENLSYEDIQRITGLPEGTVKSRLHRARLALKAAVEALSGEKKPT